MTILDSVGIYGANTSSPAIHPKGIKGRVDGAAGTLEVGEILAAGITGQVISGVNASATVGTIVLNKGIYIITAAINYLMGTRPTGGIIQTTVALNDATAATTLISSLWGRWRSAEIGGETELQTATIAYPAIIAGDGHTLNIVVTLTDGGSATGTPTTTIIAGANNFRVIRIA